MLLSEHLSKIVAYPDSREGMCEREQSTGPRAIAPLIECGERLKSGLTVGHKGGKERTIDLVNEARGLLYDYFQQGERKASVYVFTRKPREKARERERDRRMTLDGRWHPPIVAATQSEGAPGRSQVHQRHRFPRSPSRFCAPGAGSRLEPGRGGLLPKGDASHSNDYSVHASRPKAA